MVGRWSRGLNGAFVSVSGSCWGWAAFSARVARGGVAKDPAVRQAAIDRICAAATEAGAQVLGTIPSPITGAKKGNLEELLHLQLAAC